MSSGLGRVLLGLVRLGVAAAWTPCSRDIGATFSMPGRKGLIMSSESVRPARVRFLTTAEGGRMAPPVPGVRSQIDLGKFQTSCIVEGESGKSQFSLGEIVGVHIRVLFAEQVGTDFASARAVHLYEGSKLVAEGEFLDVQQ